MCSWEVHSDPGLFLVGSVSDAWWELRSARARRVLPVPWAGFPRHSPVMAALCPRRFPRLHSAVIRTFVLVQHYAAALMAVSGLPQMKNHTSVETLEMAQNLLHAPARCPRGHGLMVLLRVPCAPLAAMAYQRLAHVRARLALEERFEIILGNPSTGVTVGKHFVRQLQVGTQAKCGRAPWRPARASGLLGPRRPSSLPLGLLLQALATSAGSQSSSQSLAQRRFSLNLGRLQSVREHREVEQVSDSNRKCGTRSRASWDRGCSRPHTCSPALSTAQLVRSR